MAARVHELRLAELSELVAGRMGLFFPQTRWRDLERGICAAAPGVGVWGS
jgi:chemotaxis protein methyltransferase CheR